eukprot:3381274-Alexandrium_andersonii.AAC.1
MRPRDGWDTPRVLYRARRVAWSSPVAYALCPLVLGSSAGHAVVRLQQVIKLRASPCHMRATATGTATR